MPNFSIRLRDVKEQAGLNRLAVFINHQCATAHLPADPDQVGVEQGDENTAKQDVVVDPYPLAEWFAVNWWRLRWEAECTGLPLQQQQDWNMSHQLAAAGEGFIWPDITLASDDDTVLCTVRTTDGSLAPIQFIQAIQAHVSTLEFEQGVDNFMAHVVAYFPPHDDLNRLWQAVCNERGDPAATLWRKLEAKAGFDPDDAPEALVQKFQHLIQSFGRQSVEELASARLASPAKDIDQLLDTLNNSQHIMRPEPLALDQAMPQPQRMNQPLAPWQKAAQAAKQVRTRIGIASGPLKNQVLCDYLGLSERVLRNTDFTLLPAAGLKSSQGFNVALGAGRVTSLRFGLSRLLGDTIYTHGHEGFLPATHAKTARQKFQRAFAQELLCPYEALKEWLDTENPNDELLESAAEHFQVSPLVAKYTYQNRAA